MRARADRAWSTDREPMSLALDLYLMASRIAGPLAPGLLRRRLVRGKENPVRLGERLGQPGAARPEGRLIWVHAASVGEAVSALPLIEALLAGSETRVLMTTGTVTSAERMAVALPLHAQHQFVPVDTASAVRGFLDHWRPNLAIWIESELWPRLVVETSRRGIPMAMVNARISERSAARWSRARGMAADLFGKFGLIRTQDAETLDRLRLLGVEATFGGNLKALAPVPEPDPDELARFRDVVAGRPVWLAASTHEGEDVPILEAQRALADTDALLILAPRHPERADQVAALVAEHGLDMVRRSDGDLPTAGTQVYLADTMGEMGLWYKLAPLTFVGGSLVARGGHTPFEPQAVGSAVLHGPHVENFAPAYAALAAAEAAVEVPADGLATTVRDLCDDASVRTAMANRAHEVHEALKPDVAALARDLLALMEPAA